MRSTTTKSQQEYINSLLEKRKKKDTLQMLTISEQRDRMVDYENENKIGSETGRADMTYMERIQFDNSYNNFR
jgi:hypothetical protein